MLSCIGLLFQLICLTAAALSDARTRTVPDRYSLGLLIASLPGRLAAGGPIGRALPAAAADAVISILPLCCAALLLSRQEELPLGGADIKMVAALGFAQGVPATYRIICHAGCLVFIHAGMGALYGGRNRLQRPQYGAVPFIVFLYLAALPYYFTEHLPSVVSIL